MLHTPSVEAKKTRKRDLQYKLPSQAHKQMNKQGTNFLPFLARSPQTMCVQYAARQERERRFLP
ncbi:hypothetical protein AN396_03555 [Candidatus Epulonipiscium fishelsonii]|uniref:Uncharacterized protein n=1 Tax=Candidatus Epulonipiscium fishelsonii TaxID=77094 RepID=A0ACC8XEC3_9FIRM|nr:hypothetical protein AN396_03555 [Epulopiscium sp. SCG-B11WGA-EpuloA1]